ncbi:MAG: hypothetical protein ABFD69_14210 [Candidatus Sumerlaeia bacterium]
MGPLVFALVFVIVEGLALFFLGCFGYARLRTRLEEVEPHAPSNAAMGEAVTQLIDAHHWLLDQRARTGADPEGQARTYKAITALREFAGRLAAGERISPAHCRQMVQLCCEMARSSREEAPEPPAGAEAEPVAETSPEPPAETAEVAGEVPAEAAPAQAPPQN